MDKLARANVLSKYRTRSWAKHPRRLHRLLIVNGLQSLWTHHPDKSFIQLLHMVIDPENRLVVSIPVSEDQFRDNLYQLIKKVNIEREE